MKTQTFAPVTGTLAAALILAGCAELLDPSPDLVLPTPRVVAAPATAQAVIGACKSHINIVRGQRWAPPAQFVWDYDKPTIIALNCPTWEPFREKYASVYVDICEPTETVIALRDALTAQGVSVPAGCERGIDSVARSRQQVLQPLFTEHCRTRKPSTVEGRAQCQVLVDQLGPTSRSPQPSGMF